MARIARLEIPALCISNALAYVGPGGQPIWVAAFIKNRLLATSEIGWLATGELLLLATSTLSVSAWGQRVSPRLAAVAAASLVAIANAIAMIPAVQTVVIGRLLSGLAMGALLACITGIAARRPDAQRVLASMQAVFLLLISCIYFISPMLIDRFGPAGLFALVGGIGVVASATALSGLPELGAGAARVSHTGGAPKLAPVLGCLALASVATGTNMVGTYMITIGNELGFDARTMGNVLAVATPLAVLGPVTAHILGERAGLLPPILIALVVATIDIFFLLSAASPLLLGIFWAVLPMALAFCVPYAIALVSRVDASGRFASASQAFIMIGSAAAPKLGSELIGLAHFQAFAAATAACIAASIVLFSTAAGMRACPTQEI